MNANKQTSWQLCIYDYRIWSKIYLLPKFTLGFQFSEIINKKNVVYGHHNVYHALTSETWMYSMSCVHLFFLHYIKVTNKSNVAGYAYCTIAVYVASILVTIIKRNQFKSRHENVTRCYEIIWCRDALHTIDNFYCKLYSNNFYCKQTVVRLTKSLTNVSSWVCVFECLATGNKGQDALVLSYAEIRQPR